ncbi:MAG: cytochrome-c oxidase, cbb3-type subunit II [Phenylobacterium sp.]|uniref:cytochrome-c oxidase, cbb3-type subunit II n=1 Tax=Phenylobacterium sp. TaxID=1871053 RepID=UPI0025F75464|nr:cytochrome-c oxidase, cbb3-type subunit II [Phenylobacterium sp.]MBA4011718.1 cytochrome-c oxidase, cbb3-type subunit II [Phenylobacterium sp.]
MWKHHTKLEKHSLPLVIAILIVVSIGGIVEIAPLFWLESTVEEVEGVRPYTPLELAGRDIYIREGCYTCHSQMVRPLRDEVERYGHYSLAAESMYDHPFQWGSKRTGPDLARVGGKYSDGWHKDHLVDPRSVVPESVMPPYAFLAEKALDYRDIQDKIRAMTKVGVPYTQDMIDSAKDDLETQADPFAAASKFQARYGGKVIQRDFDGEPDRLSEMDALIAYLQMLGTLVDFSTYEAKAPENRR